MKLKYFFLLFVLPNIISGQNFLSENKKWNVLNIGQGSFSTSVFYLNGFDTINGKIYSKLYEQNTFYSSNRVITHLREDSNIIYELKYDQEFVLYNFNAQPGDSLKITNLFCFDQDFNVSIEAIDSIEYLGIKRKRWLLNKDGNHDYWVEGIGNLSGILFTFQGACFSCPGQDLLCFSENNTIFYVNEMYNTCYSMGTLGTEKNLKSKLQVFPNPVSPGIDIQLSSEIKIKSVQLMDTQGKTIREIQSNQNNRINIKTSQLKPSLYFIQVMLQDGNIETQKIILN